LEALVDISDSGTLKAQRHSVSGWQTFLAEAGCAARCGQWEVMWAISESVI